MKDRVGYNFTERTEKASTLLNRVCMSSDVIHAVLGMHAFGLEETGDYARAERAGHLSVELEPRDGWGQHSVAHVMEMQNRRREGIAWMRGNQEGWSRDGFSAIHNWWHLALFHLGLDEIDEVLALYDSPIYGKTPNVILEMIDASALLWRLPTAGRQCR